MWPPEAPHKCIETGFCCYPDHETGQNTGPHSECPVLLLTEARIPSARPAPSGGPTEASLKRKSCCLPVKQRRPDGKILRQDEILEVP